MYFSISSLCSSVSLCINKRTFLISDWPQSQIYTLVDRAKLCKQCNEKEDAVEDD